MSGRRSRDKGNRTERGIVNAFQLGGFAAERVPLSGAARGRFGGDISVPLLGKDCRVEVKCRAGGFKQMYQWLDPHDFLVCKADNLEPFVVVRLSRFIDIAKRAELTKNVVL